MHPNIAGSTNGVKKGTGAARSHVVVFETIEPARQSNAQKRLNEDERSTDSSQLFEVPGFPSLPSAIIVTFFLRPTRSLLTQI